MAKLPVNDLFTEDEISGFWALLNNCNHEDIILFYKQMRKLCNLVTSYMKIKTYKDIYDSAKLFKKLKNRKGNCYKMLKTPYAKLEFALKDKNTKLINDILKEHPNLFVERFTTIAKDIDIKTIDLDSIIKNTTTKMLFRLWNLIKMHKEVENLDVSTRLFKLPHCIYVDLDGKFPKIDKNNLEYVELYIIEELKERFSDVVLVVEENSNINFDIKLPLSLRVSGEGLFYEIGTNFPIDADKVRAGIWWLNGDEKVDLDLSAYLVGEYNSLIVGWNGDYKVVYKTVLAVFSGDMTDAPKPYGASEFIDLDIDELRKRGFKYVL